MSTSSERNSDMDLIARIKQLKLQRGYAKARLTKRCTEIRELMQDMENVSFVTSRLNDMEPVIGEFMSAHVAYHEMLSIQQEIDSSQIYIDSFNLELNNLKRDISDWALVATRLSDAARDIKVDQVVHAEVHQPPSVLENRHSRFSPNIIDNIEHLSVAGSRMSKSSSVTSARAKASARKAELLVEAATLSQQRNLEQEELRIKQKRREFEIQTELAMAEAREHALSDVDVVTPPVITNSLQQNKFDHILHWQEDVGQYCHDMGQLPEFSENRSTKLPVFLEKKPTKLPEFPEYRHTLPEFSRNKPNLPTLNPMADSWHPISTYK